ncbi:MAG: hypothetical protein KatS3mg105_2584 [Gemmatales bacterium]|nr:MAG: hypothetical protein KatS3mg105_2584 [Gemmatales bacterium]
MITPENLPGVNAVLNTTSALLIVAGFIAIRRRRVGVHKTCMLSAFVVSSAFLASYLYYHFVVRHGTPTYFTGQGWLRPLYFAILISHTILAIVTAPLVLYSIFLGLMGKWQRHKRIARWTLPLWLYVSVTGVLVYWMLYRLG